MKKLIKRLFFALFIIIQLPVFLLVKMFIYLRTEELYLFFGQLFSLIPGKLGSYFRVSYYYLLGSNVSPDVFIGFGSYFSKREIHIASNASIGAFCVLGNVSIGEETLIASKVSIPSGRHQHSSNEDGEDKWEDMNVELVKIGAKSWIGESALVLANVGDNCIVGGGSVVVKEIPDNSVAVGNPAKVLRSKNQK